MRRIFITISILVIAAVVLITFEVPYFSKMVGFSKILWMSAAFCFLISSLIYFLYSKNQKGEDQYVAIGSSILLSFVIGVGLISYANRHLSVENCFEKKYNVLHYEARYSSGHGALKSEKIEANQWILTVAMDDSDRTFTLTKDITYDDVTNTVNLVFCKGVLSTFYLRE